MSTPKNGQTPSGGEFDAGAAAGLDLDEAAASAFTASLTEFQRLLLSAGAVVAILNQVKAEAAAGRASVAGVWHEAETSVLTIRPQQEISLVGIKMPIEFAERLLSAYVAARDTEEGRELQRRIAGLLDSEKAKHEGPQ